MAKIVTMGEIMLRLSTPNNEKFIQADEFDVNYGGGEANVAVSLANYGHDAEFVTAVPANPIGECAVAALRKYNVGTKHIARSGERLGIYFLETGSAMRASNVVYDRAHSSISTATPDQFNFDEIFEGADWFHFTGITPALGGENPEICLDACKAAKAKGVKISCDLNFRKKLWSSEQAGKVMGELMPYVDVCIANEEDAADVFGIHAEGTDINTGKISREGYIGVAKQLSERFGCEYVAITLRGSISATDNKWAGMLYKDGQACFSPEYLVHIVDRVGGGDSFGGGLIHALRKGMDQQDAINFAVAASCLKHTIEHDFNLVSEAEVLSLAGGNASGRVQR